MHSNARDHLLITYVREEGSDRYMNERITIEDFERALYVTRNTLYAYIKKDVIRPYNKDDWHLDGEYLFTSEEFERVKENFKRPDGYTTREAAEMLNISTGTVTVYAQQGKIIANRHHYKGKDQYFIPEAEVLRLKSEPIRKVNKAKKTFLNRRWGVYLFQPYRHKTNDSLARITSIGNSEDEDVVLTTDTLTEIPFSYVRKDYEPAISFNQGKPIIKKGWVHFRFPLPSNMTSQIFTFIDRFVNDVGVRNMDMKVSEKRIDLYVKPVLLPLEWEEEVDELQGYLMEGTLHIRYNGVYIDSEVETIQAGIHRSIKEKIQKEAVQDGMTIEDKVAAILKEYTSKGLDEEQKSE